MANKYYALCKTRLVNGDSIGISGVVYYWQTDRFMLYFMSMPGGILRAIFAPEQCGEGKPWSELYSNVETFAEKEAARGTQVGIFCMEDLSFPQLIASIGADIDEAFNMPKEVREQVKDATKKNMITVIRACVKK